MKLELNLDLMDEQHLDAAIAALSAWKTALVDGDAKPVVARNTGSLEPAKPHTSPAGDPAGSETVAVANPPIATDADTAPCRVSPFIGRRIHDLRRAVGAIRLKTRYRIGKQMFAAVEAKSIVRARLHKVDDVREVAVLFIL